MSDELEVAQVESGLLCIIDPLYLADAKTPDGAHTSEWYESLFNSDLGDAGDLRILRTPGSGEARGVVFATGGVGDFRISTEYDYYGEPVRIVIDLLGLVDGEEDDE